MPFGAVLPALARTAERRRHAGRSAGHDFFFVLETDNYEALVEGLRPIIPSGTAAIQPVGDMGATVAKHCRRKLNQHCSPRWPSGSSTEDRKKFTIGLSYRR